MEKKTLSLPRLNCLSPSLESTALKLMEEAGELAQLIGKFRGMSGEKLFYPESRLIEEISKELLDVAQTAVTMMFVMEEEHGVDIELVLKAHLEKLVAKGYISY